MKPMLWREHGLSQPVGRDLHAREAYEVVGKAGGLLYGCVTQYDIATHEGLAHHREPLLRGGLDVGGCDDDVLVVSRLDTHVYGHLHRDGEAGVVLYLCNQQSGVAQTHIRELLVEVVVGTDVHNNNLIQSTIFLCHDERQSLVDVVVILGKEGYDDRHGGLGVELLATARVTEICHAAIHHKVVVQLHEEEHEECSGQG